MNSRVWRRSKNNRNTVWNSAVDRHQRYPDTSSAKPNQESAAGDSLQNTDQVKLSEDGDATPAIALDVDQCGGGPKSSGRNDAAADDVRHEKHINTRISATSLESSCGELQNDLPGKSKSSARNQPLENGARNVRPRARRPRHGRKSTQLGEYDGSGANLNTTEHQRGSRGDTYTSLSKMAEDKQFNRPSKNTRRAERRRPQSNLQQRPNEHLNLAATGATSSCVSIIFRQQLQDETDACNEIKQKFGFNTTENQLEIITVEESGNCVVNIRCSTLALAKRLADVVREVDSSALNLSANEVSDQSWSERVPLVRKEDRRSITTDQRLDKADNSPEDDPIHSCMVSVNLKQEMDKKTAAEYISKISQFRLIASVIEYSVIQPGDGKFRVDVKCRSRRLAANLVSAINQGSAETMVTAEIKHSDVNIIESVWKKFHENGQQQMDRHEKKIADAERQISEAKRKYHLCGSKRGVTMQDFERHEASIVPLKSKLAELRLQKDEFLVYMKDMQVELEETGQSKNMRELLEGHRKEFGLELTRFESALPMYARKTDIVNTIRNNSVSIILGETGSGKSTQILQYLHNAGFSGTIVCTQPRKVAAISVATRVAQEMGSNVGKTVGYQVGMNRRRGPDTRLLYVTDHSLLNECLQDPQFRMYSCIVVDEAHERSIYTDLLLGFLKKALLVRDDLHVVIMSATINPEIFRTYFQTSSSSEESEQPPVLKVSGRAFPVDVYYDAKSDAPKDYVEASFRKALDIHCTEGQGDILVFLTSPNETEKASKKMLDNSTRGDMLVLELHGKLQVEDQQKVFNPTPAGKRKIVFATNIAETSITIPGIRYVVDSGKVREVSFDAKRNMSSLDVQWVTQSSAEQRKGRAGRTESGKCFRLYSEAEFNKFRKDSVPEIMRIHLGQAMLKLLLLNIDNPMEFDFVETPDKNALANAMSVLNELGAYDEKGITELGQKMAKLSLEPRLAKVAIRGVEDGMPLESALMASVATAGGSIFFRAGTNDAKEVSDRRKTKFCDEWGDIITFVNVYKEWDTLPEKQRNKWCYDNSINAKSMRNCRETLNEMRHMFRTEFGVAIPNTFTALADVCDRMAKILFECYSSNLARFCGHSREGYCMANSPTTIMRVHPSSALYYIEELPRWVIFEQILTTTDTFMLNATFVREDWVVEKMSAGKLKISMEAVQSTVLEHLDVFYVGSLCIQNLLQNKAERKNELEKRIRNLSKTAKCILEVDSCDKTSGGTLKVFVTSNVRDGALTLIEKHIQGTMNSIENECIETSLLPNSDVRVVIERGGRIRTILMPTETRRVKITLRVHSSRVSVDEEQMKCVMSRYGAVERIDRDIKQANVWGYVTFKLPQHANECVANARNRLPDHFDVGLHVVGDRGRPEFVYTLKVVGQRRPLRGFGYVKCQSAVDARRMASKGRSFLLQKKWNDSVVFVETVNMEIEKRHDDELYLSNVPYWADTFSVKDGLQTLTRMDVNSVNVVLPRDRVPSTAESNELNAEFVSCIKKTLAIRSAGICSSDFEIIAIQSKEKDYYETAYIKFKDASKAQLALEFLKAAEFNGHPLDAGLDLKVSFVVHQSIYNYFKAHINSKLSQLQRETAGELKLTERPNKRFKELMNVDVSGSSVGDLLLARNKLQTLLTGHRLSLDRQQILFMSSSSGKKFRDSMEKSLRAKIRVEDRQKAVFVHTAAANSVADIERRFAEHMQARIPEIVQQIRLRGSAYKRGTMKALVETYGLNLERLKAECDLTELQLVLRQHLIRYQGNREAGEKLKQLVDEVSRTLRPSVHDSDPSSARVDRTPECPVCCAPVDDDSLYVTQLCGHVYCRSCLSGLVRNSLLIDEMPIRCAADGCESRLSVQDLKNLLGTNLQDVYDAAVRSFMSNPDCEFNYCITADCRMVYRRALQFGAEQFTCSECQITVCTSCHVEYHAGESCEAFQRQRLRQTKTTAV